MENIVHVEDLSVAYNDVPVLIDVDVDIRKNSRTAIIGPNGAGKSTLLKSILGLIKPITGEITILGKKYKEVYREIAYIPQINSVNWDFPATVFDVVLMGRYSNLGWIKRPTKKDKEIAKNAIEQMGMTEFSKHQISELSGGQRQRVFIARAIAQKSQIYFMDEPMQGVDIKTQEIIVSLIFEFQKQGKTIIVVHHDLSTIKDYFDNVILLNKKIIASGDVNTVFSDENLALTYR